MRAAARTHLIRVPLYEADVRLVVGRDLGAAYQHARARAPAMAATVGVDEAAACVPVDGVPWILLAADATPGQIAHESLHAAVMVLRDRGISLDAGRNDEAICYVLQYIVDRVSAWYARQSVQ